LEGFGVRKTSAVAALLFFLLTFVAGCGMPKAAPLDLVLPETWQGFTRASAVNGAEALPLFQKEHIKRVPFHQALRNEYTRGQDTIRVWIAAGSDEGHAAQMLVTMSNKIGPNHKTFSEPKPVEIAGVTMYTMTGQDATNFVFNKGKYVYWIAIAAPDPEGLVKQLYQDF
jgi:hypothetical protein